MKEEFINKTKEVIQNAVNEQSKLGAYLAGNPRIKNPKYDDKFELRRVVNTWYRCGILYATITSYQ